MTVSCIWKYRPCRLLEPPFSPGKTALQTLYWVNNSS